MCPQPSTTADACPGRTGDARTPGQAVSSGVAATIAAVRAAVERLHNADGAAQAAAGRLTGTGPEQRHRRRLPRPLTRFGPLPCGQRRIRRPRFDTAAHAGRRAWNPTGAGVRRSRPPVQSTQRTLHQCGAEFVCTSETSWPRTGKLPQPVQRPVASSTTVTTPTASSGTARAARQAARSLPAGGARDGRRSAGAPTERGRCRGRQRGGSVERPQRRMR